MSWDGGREEKIEIGDGMKEKWYEKLLMNEGIRERLGRVKDRMGDLFQGEEDIITQSVLFGLKGMLDYEEKGPVGLGEWAYQIEEKLDNIIEGLRLDNVGLGKLDRILELVNRVVAEGVKAERLLGLPGRIDELQADLDEVLRYCGRIEGIRRESGENKKGILAIEEKVDRLFEMAEDLLYGNYEEEESSEAFICRENRKKENSEAFTCGGNREEELIEELLYGNKKEAVRAKDFLEEHYRGKRNVFLKLSNIIEEVLEVLGKGEKKVSLPF